MEQTEAIETVKTVGAVLMYLPPYLLAATIITGLAPSLRNRLHLWQTLGILWAASWTYVHLEDIRQFFLRLLQ